MNFRKLFSEQHQLPETGILVLATILSLAFHFSLISPVSYFLQETKIETEEKSSPVVELQSAPQEDDKNKPLGKKEEEEERIFTDPKKRVLSEHGTREDDDDTDPSKLPPKLASKNFPESVEKYRSPLRLEKTPEPDYDDVFNEDGSFVLQEPEIPEEIRKTMRGSEPEKTEQDDIQFTMNSYKWTFERYVENWAADLRKWWRAPSDYLAGKQPRGGSVWIRVTLAKDGKLEGYKVYKSMVTSEMELRVVQALIGSFERPDLPKSFPEEQLVINWRFIYPPINANVQMKK